MSRQSETSRRSAAIAGHGQVEDRTYEALRELIVTGRLPPGGRAVETRLAARLGVSRTPVRAAIARLSREGFLVPTTSGRRIEHRAAPVGVEDMEELWGIMGALESHALRRIDRLSEPDRRALAEELRSINRELRSASSARPRDVERLADLQGAFHTCFIERCAGKHLRTMHEGIRPHLRRYEWAYGTQAHAPYEPSTQEHEEIIDAIRDGDGERAATLVVRHWDGAARRTTEIMEGLDWDERQGAPNR